MANLGDINGDGYDGEICLCYHRLSFDNISKNINVRAIYNTSKSIIVYQCDGAVRDI